MESALPESAAMIGSCTILNTCCTHACDKTCPLFMARNCLIVRLLLYLHQNMLHLAVHILETTLYRSAEICCNWLAAP